MNSKALRRLAGDHASLHKHPLPPNYLFPLKNSDNDNLTSLDILLAGPSHTPFAAGVWKLHLTMPAHYPSEPPTAHFRTPIFHPNVDPQTGGVCVETLKRDWDAKLTLRDVLVTISCLLIQPNPDSALNADAGSLIQEDYESFAKRARLMASVHAKVPADLREAVKDAQSRGQEIESDEDDEMHILPRKRQSIEAPKAPVRQRRVTARQRGTTAARKSDGSPSGAPTRQQHQAVPPSNPFVFQAGNDDIFGFGGMPTPHDSFEEHQPNPRVTEWDDSTMMTTDQENDESRSPIKPVAPPKASTPGRRRGTPVPLGELTLDDLSDSSDEDMEPEYPPSPRKSPSKSPVKPQRQRRRLFEPLETPDHAESSRDAAQRAPDQCTPPNATEMTLLPDDSHFSISIQPSPSPRKVRTQWQSPGRGAPSSPRGLFAASTPGTSGGVFKTSPPSSIERQTQERRRQMELETKLWRLCGEDIKRWNCGDFDDEVFTGKGGRW